MATLSMLKNSLDGNSNVQDENEEQIDEDQLEQLLDSVSLKAFSLEDSKFQKMTGEQKHASNINKSSKSSTESKGIEDQLSSLPVSLKLQIASLLPKESSYTTEIKEKLPAVKILGDKFDPKRIRLFSKEELEALDTKGYFIRDSFLGSSFAEAAQKEADVMKEEGKLKSAGMGRGSDFWNDTQVRGDLIVWLNENKFSIKDSCPNLYTLLQKMQSLRKELNSACDLDSQHTQLTCYPGNGSRYARHLDAYVGGASRRITVLYYLNPGWKKEDGGCLRLYLEDGGDKDIEPIADRLLIFQSRRVEHEVMPAYSKRYAVTMWFY